MILRPYQQAAVDAAMTHLRKSVDPILIDAAPAAGKSYMIAKLSDELHKISGKKVLALAPSKELVEQDHEKFLLTGNPASVFSASAGAKSTRHNVIFGTPLTVKNAISRFTNNVCAVIVDEAHGITPTIKEIIDAIRRHNPMLRVIGLTGTPFRLGAGYIFRMWPDDRVNGDDTARDPYFVKCVYRVSAREMLDQKFITPMLIGAINERYDTDSLVLLPNGHFNSEDVDRAFVGHGRKTAAIVADVLDKAKDRPGGVMFFAATVRHAEEVMASLPKHNSAIVTGTTGKKDRENVIMAYRSNSIRYLVNVGTLTTGFDVEHTETIALLRATESAALLQQILGRAWRLHPDKKDSLLLDYAGNIERHFPDGDIYNPVINAGKSATAGEAVTASCPDCGYSNEFTRNADTQDYKLDENGYCLDVFGERIETDYGPMPGHYGRRCFGMVRTGKTGEYSRCNYRWTGKDCPTCGEINDIAARYCYVCKAEIVDPNEKLQADFKALKRDPTQVQTDEVITMDVKPGVSQRGNKTIRVDWKTPYRQFSTWFTPESNATRAQKDWDAFDGATIGGKMEPKTITYCKDPTSSFYRILAYNKPADTLQLEAA